MPRGLCTCGARCPEGTSLILKDSLPRFISVSTERSCLTILQSDRRRDGHWGRLGWPWAGRTSPQPQGCTASRHPPLLLAGERRLPGGRPGPDPGPVALDQGPRRVLPPSEPPFAPLQNGGEIGFLEDCTR